MFDNASNWGFPSFFTPPRRGPRREFSVEASQAREFSLGGIFTFLFPPPSWEFSLLAPVELPFPRRDSNGIFTFPPCGIFTCFFECVSMCNGFLQSTVLFVLSHKTGQNIKTMLPILSPFTAIYSVFQFFHVQCRANSNIYIRNPSKTLLLTVFFQWNRRFSLFPPVEASQAREFSLFPPVGASQAREFSLFPRGGFPS